MVRLVLFAALALGARAVAPVASGAEVKQLRVKLEKVIGSGGLPEKWVAEAHRIEDDADKALASAGTNASKASLEHVVQEFHHFVGELASLRASIEAKGSPAAESQPSAETVARAWQLSQDMKEKLLNILPHLQQDDRLMTDAEKTQRAAVVKQIQDALAMPPAEILDKAVALHRAMQAAHDFFASRTAHMVEEQAKLHADLDKSEGHILYMMLKQRRKLPIRSQLAVLKRKQYAKFPLAQQLLAKHNDKDPLYQQLEALLPKEQVAELNKKDAAKSRLAASGSDGSVIIVSSKIKNSVKSLTAELTAVRDKLKVLCNDPTAGSEHDRGVAKTVAANLDAALARVSNTTDLAAQLTILDDVEKNVGIWMKSVR